MSVEDQMELGLATLEDFEAAQTALDMDAPVSQEAESAVTVETMNIGDPEPADEPEPVVIDMNEKKEVKTVSESSAPLCTACGNQTVRAGACYVCTACGSSTGCG